MRILLADDQPEVRFALRALLEQQPGLVVVGEATDAGDLLLQAKTACPDLVLLDWPLPGSAPADLLAALRRGNPRMPVIAMSGRPETRPVALVAGAVGFVNKCDPPEQLLEAISCCLLPIPDATFVRCDVV